MSTEIRIQREAPPEKLQMQRKVVKGNIDPSGNGTGKIKFYYKDCKRILEGTFRKFDLYGDGTETIVTWGSMSMKGKEVTHRCHKEDVRVGTFWKSELKTMTQRHKNTVVNGKQILSRCVWQGRAVCMIDFRKEENQFNPEQLWVSRHPIGG
jgi:hypothetical protein